MDRYFRARTALGLAVLLAAGAEFSGFGLSISSPAAIGPLTLTLLHPDAIPYLALLAVAYLLYRYHIEWFALAAEERDKSIRVLDHRLTTATTLWVVLAIYGSETITHWKNGWVPHALAAGAIALATLIVWLVRPTVPLLLQRLLVLVLATLFILEPLLHHVPYLHWLSIATIPALIILEAVLLLGQRKVVQDARAERLVRS